MNASDLRKIAQNLSDERAQADADANGLLARYLRMREAGTYGLADMQSALVEHRDADERAAMLAEQEYHAWEAYSNAREVEHYQDTRDG